MDGEAPEGAGGPKWRDESEWDRLDRNLNELLQELRVALPGVQVLFAFLLTVPFAQGFTALSDFQRNAYFAVLVLTAISTVLLIAPTAYHRILFRAGRKREVVAYANRMVILGLAALALAMVTAVALIAHVVFGEAAAIVTGAVALGLIGALWYAMPFAVRRGQR
jgi:cation transport ATPase